MYIIQFSFLLCRTWGRSWYFSLHSVIGMGEGQGVEGRGGGNSRKGKYNMNMYVGITNEKTGSELLHNIHCSCDNERRKEVRVYPASWMKRRNDRYRRCTRIIIRLYLQGPERGIKESIKSRENSADKSYMWPAMTKGTKWAENENRSYYLYEKVKRHSPRKNSGEKKSDFLFWFLPRFK